MTILTVTPPPLVGAREAVARRSSKEINSISSSSIAALTSGASRLDLAFPLASVHRVQVLVPPRVTGQLSDTDGKLFENADQTGWSDRLPQWIPIASLSVKIATIGDADRSAATKRLSISLFTNHVAGRLLAMRMLVRIEMARRPPKERRKPLELPGYFFLHGNAIVDVDHEVN